MSFSSQIYTYFKQNKKYLLVDSILLIIILILCYLVFFQGLGEYSARMWDESRNGINALEMLKTKNPIVTFYQGAPDLWNTKPPLLIWAIALSFKIFGVSEFALRLPSALSATAVIITMYLFAAKVLKDRWIGLLSTLILLSSFGFSDAHIGRTGDYDAMLTLWVFLASINTFFFLSFKKNKYILISMIFWTLAGLTKGIGSMLIVPGIMIYILLTKQFMDIVTNKYFWKGAGIFVLVIGGYYIGRNILNPGYLHAVWIEELFERSTKNNETTTNMFLYYWNWLKDFRFQHWIFFLPVSIMSFFIIKSKVIKDWVLYSYIIIIAYYLVISIAQSKNIWYDAQLYPFASLLVAILLVSFIKKIPTPLWIIPVVILSFYMQRYLRTNLAYIQRPDLEKSNSCLKYGYLFRENTLNTKGLVGVHNGYEYCMPFTFYMEKESIPIKNISEVKSLDKVITCDDATLTIIKSKFKTREFFNNKNSCVGILVQ